MKLHCKTEIHERTLLVHKKLQRSILAFVKDSVKDNSVCFYLWTRLNKQGTKYKIINNIRKVFMKFINDGKATISLIQPCHDLIIQCDAIQLKSFLNVLKHIANGHYKDIDKYILKSNITISSSEFYSLEKVVVVKKCEYPILQGFPRMTEQLVLSGLDRKSFDRQILTLQSLRFLDLSNNKISFLPKELGTLPHLQALDLSYNNLGKSVQSKWAWLEQIALRSNLNFLNLSNNLLTKLPTQIGWLKALKELKIRDNMLRQLPQNIGTLNKLQLLDVAKNNLMFLPGTIQYLRLYSLDISDNLFSTIVDHNIVFDKSIFIGLPSLVESSARNVLKSRITYDASLIPYTLVQYLDEAKYCFSCKDACFDCYSKVFTHFYSSKFSMHIKNTLNQPFKFECYFCSMTCHNYYVGKYIE
ncbi:leucine-rich repeat protein 1 [Cataglyphis hispanica]|uniref:leucine-rich repeat protein 1 n=1 Tax=Cataglyphis hispanica TaxID=1086592 RepID=UPI00217F7894|nr:leucine-rich repeat protein 1 [Cataglyphis hispanica]XP_050466545.1 leucine-rich repeat protein 1 [Cataglyphis hispanica]XP_050466546.1 leucine-rich repeat protein 1 [Cataglyphis hispanica]XP_050466547.1 leucine-rich repeat protein 1 [Cataglyphis hispanica]XP_050466548.1 leucine-rich repeat protein 1 [Cataglyphis hispanica]